MKDQSIDLQKIIAALAAYYNQSLEDHVLEMYAEDLIDIPIEILASVLKEIRRDPKITRFPLPAVIRSKSGLGVSDIDIGRDLSAKIFGAIGRHGYTWPEKVQDWPAPAVSELGDLAWGIIKQFGGWRRMCELSAEMNPGTFLAQIRDLGESMARRPKHEYVETKALPEYSNDGLQPLRLTEIMNLKTMPKSDDE